MSPNLSDSEAIELSTVADGVPGYGGHHPQHLPHLLRGVHHELHRPTHRQELDKWDMIKNQQDNWLPGQMEEHEETMKAAEDRVWRLFKDHSFNSLLKDSRNLEFYF